MFDELQQHTSLKWYDGKFFVISKSWLFKNVVDHKFGPYICDSRHGAAVVQHHVVVFFPETRLTLDGYPAAGYH